MKDAPKVAVTTRYEPHVYAAIVKIATKEKRPFNAQVNLLLERAIKHSQFPKG